MGCTQALKPRGSQVAEKTTEYIYAIVTDRQTTAVPTEHRACCTVALLTPGRHFGIVSRDVLWQVLQQLGACERILDIKSLYAHNSSAEQSLQ